MAAVAIPIGQNDRVKAGPSDRTAGTLIDKVISSDGSVGIELSSCGCEIDLSTSTLANFGESWIYASMEYTVFDTPLALSIITPPEWANIPAGSTVIAYKLKHSAAFTGGNLGSVTVALHFGGVTFAGLDVFPAPTPTNGISGSIPDGSGILNHSSTDEISISMVSVGANINQLATGTLDCWVKIATLT